MSDETSPLLANAQQAVTNGTFKHASDDTDVPITPTEPVEEEVEELKTGVLATIVIPLTIGIFLAAMDQTIVVASYASIGSDLQELQKTSWIATSYMLTLTSFQPLYGKLSDTFGRKPMLLTAYVIFLLGSLFCGLSLTMNQLILSRALAGIGGGGMSTLVSIIMSDMVPLRKRGIWQGIINIVFATGSSTGAPLGGFLADTVGWRWSFLAQVPMTLLAILSVSYFLHLAPPTHQAAASSHQHTTLDKIKRIDFSGALSLILTVLSLLVGLENSSSLSWGSPYTYIPLVLSGGFFVVLMYVELHYAQEPFAPKRIIFSPSLVAAYWVNFFGIACSMPLLFHVSLYLQAVRSKSPSDAGFFLVPSIIAGVVGSLFGGFVIQRTGRFYGITLIAYVMQLVGVVGLLLVTGILSDSLVALVVALFVSGLGNGIGITTSLIALIANAGRGDQAIATAVSYLFRSLGSVVGLSIASTILQANLRTNLRRGLERLDLDIDVEGLTRTLLHSLSTLPSLPLAVREVVAQSYEEAIRLSTYFCIAMAAFALVCACWVKGKDISHK